jgi:acyl carrier protein
MPKNVLEVVMSVLAGQLRMAGEELARRRDEGLDQLGLDSHGLMRVLLDIERALELTSSLEVDDEALSTPATLVAGVLKSVAPSPAT